MCQKKLFHKAAAGDTEIYKPWYWLGSSRREWTLAFRRLSCQPSHRGRVWLCIACGRALMVATTDVDDRRNRTGGAQSAVRPGRRNSYR